MSDTRKGAPCVIAGLTAVHRPGEPVSRCRNHRRADNVVAAAFGVMEQASKVAITGGRPAVAADRSQQNQTASREKRSRVIGERSVLATQGRQPRREQRRAFPGMRKTLQFGQRGATDPPLASAHAAAGREFGAT